MTGREWAWWREFPMQRQKPPPRKPMTAKRRDGKDCDVLATIGVRVPPQPGIDDTDSVSDWRPV